MSNTSTSNDKTVGDDAKVKLIIGEIGRDTKTGIIGRGYSFDNGNTFHVTDTIFGRLYDDRDADGIWNNGMHERVKEKVNQEIANTVEPAIKQADSAVAYANDAIEKSRVNSQAIVEINSAVSDAISDAAVARSDGLRAWDAAQSNVGLIDSNYASASAAISNARTEAIAAADEAKASASAAGKDITTLKSQAGQFEQDMADTKGDVSQLKVSATGFKNTLTDAQGNISTLQMDVTGLKKTTSDNRGNISSLQVKADSLTSQMNNVQGDISTLQQTASGFSSKVSGMETSLANANSKLDGITSNGGGRNLAIGTSDSWTTAPDVDRYNITTIATYTNAQAGDVFTVSVDTQSTKTMAWQIWQGSSQYTRDKYVIGGDHWAIASGTTHSYTTFTWPSGATQYLIVQLIDNMPDASHASYQYKNVMLEKGIVAHDWSPAPEDTDAKITTNSTAIEQNKKAIALKADEETVNKTNVDVALLKAQFKVQADQISGKVSSSDLDAKGYATQTYTQTLVKQTADTWNLNLTNVKNDEVKDVANLNASIDGIKADVYNKDGSSKITQLSNLIATKVSSGDYNSQITLLKNDIDLRVAKGDVISRINQEAGGNTLIQVSNGKGSLILDAGNTIVTGKEWIPVASIADLTADQIQAGTLTGSTIHLGDSNDNTIDLGVLDTDHVGLHSSAKNGDQTYIDYNGIKNSGTGYSTVISQGKITTGYMAVNGGGLIDFRSSGNGTTIDSQNIKFYNSNAVNGGIEFSGGSPLATVRNGTVGNELRVRYDRSFALTPISSDSARICASSAAMQVGFIQSGRSTPDRQTTGLWVDGDKRHVNLGVWGADSTWARVEANTHNIHMQADKAHAWLSSDNVFHIYKDGDSSSTATKLQVDGWAWINGWVEAAGHSQHSALSTKTNIQPVDDDKMLEMVNDTDLATFLYKTDVANGETHRHIGLIIDDVHDVAQYQTPQEFIAPNGVSRDDDNMIGALFGAVKALTKRIKTLESKVG